MLLALSCVVADLTREKLITGRGNLLPYSNMSDRIVSRSLSSIETAYLDLVEMAVTGSLFWEGGECHPDRTPQRPIQHDGCVAGGSGAYPAAHSSWHDWPCLSEPSV